MKTDAIGNRSGPDTQPTEGFTLIGLLVVLAATALLAAMLLPTLAQSRAQAQVLQCMNNCDRLAEAWIMYASDHKNHCANNFGAAQTDLEVARRSYNTWCLDVMDWSSSQQNTNINLLKLGQLGPYVAGAVASYKCPADHYLSGVQIAAGFRARVRSYSMNDFVGLFSECDACGGTGATGSGTDFTFQRKNQFNTSWPQYVKVSDLTQPWTIYVFVDEHPDSINDGYFDDGEQSSPASPTSWSGSDVPASYHNGAGGFAFGDAHAEMHKWQVTGPEGTTQAVALGAGYPSARLGPTGSNYTDRIWLCGHACVK